MFYENIKCKDVKIRTFAYFYTMLRLLLKEVVEKRFERLGKRSTIEESLRVNYLLVLSSSIKRITYSLNNTDA